MKKFFSTYGNVFATLLLFVFMLVPVIAGADGTGSPASNSRVLDNPLGVNSFCALVVKLVQAVMIIGIPIAILFIVWVGFKFVIAQGDTGKLKEARRNFLNVVIGLSIFIGATLIANIIVNTLQQLGVQGINSCS
jgi:hypothetical protein